MKRIIFVLMLTVGMGGVLVSQQPKGLEEVLQRLFSVEEPHSVYGQGEGALLWLEDLAVVEENWNAFEGSVRTQIRHFLLPLYMQESMGFSLFEEESEWLSIAEKILFEGRD